MAHPKQGYTLPNGDKVVGTTTVIGRFKESGGLIQWAYKQGREHEGLARQGKDAPRHLYDVVEKAADIGTVVHGMVEAHIEGREPEPPFPDDADAQEKAMSGFSAYLKWERMTHLGIVEQEMQLVCPEYRFGGTPDAIGIIDNELCLVDWKTSNAVYMDHLIQLAAYRHLVENGLRMDTGEPMGMKLTGGFHLCRFAKEHGDFAHHYFADLSEAWDAFKLMRPLFDLTKALKKRAA